MRRVVSYLLLVSALGCSYRGPHSVGPLISFQLFVPTIVNQVRSSIEIMIHGMFIKFQLGFDATAANLLSVPAYVWGCILTCVVGVIGDRRGKRGYLNL